MVNVNAVVSANVMSFNTPEGKRVEMREVNGVILRFELDHIDAAAEVEAAAISRKRMNTIERGSCRVMTMESMQEREVRNMHKLLNS